MLRHFLGNYLAVWLRECALLKDNVSFESVLISTPLSQDLMPCDRVLLLQRIVKEENECKWDLHNSDLCVS